MNRQFSKKRFMSKRIQHGSRFRLYLAIFFLLLSASVFSLCNRWLIADSSCFTTFYSKFTAWIADRRRHLEKIPTNKRMVIEQNDTEPQIHFEFYTALPNMQIAGSDLVTKKNHEKKSDVKIIEKNESEQ